MTPEMAKAVTEQYCNDAQFESATTRRVIQAMPAGKEDFKPAEKSMGMLELAYHITSTELWFLSAIADGEFPGWAPMPDSIKSFADVLADYDAKFGPALDKVRGLGGEQLLKIVDMMGAFQMPAFTYMNFLLKHSIHHRGQASVYLRLAGAKVPSIYGGSADEPFEAAASAS